MEVMIRKKNVVLDATIGSTLMSCARLADFRFNMNMVNADGKSPSLEKGSIVHKVLEVYYKHIMQGFPRDIAIGQGLAAGQMYAMGCADCMGKISGEDIGCGHQPNEYPSVRLSSDDVTYVLSVAQDYFEYYKNDHWTPLMVEETKGEILYEDDEIRILWKAKFDLVVDTNQGIYPVDHKTMNQRRDTLSLNNQFIGQCILRKTRGMFINKIGFQKTLKDNERFTRPMINYSEDRLMEWQGTILPFYAKMMLVYSESGYWPPNFTHCENKFGMCEFKSVCESDRGMRAEELRNNFLVGEAWDV